MEAALARHGASTGRCVHRLGHLDVGDVAVWVGAGAAHRDAAFAACRYVIDEVKARVPIWKKEHYVDGSSGWVGCEACASHVSTHEHARDERGGPSEPSGHDHSHAHQRKSGAR